MGDRGVAEWLDQLNIYKIFVESKKREREEYLKAVYGSKVTVYDIVVSAAMMPTINEIERMIFLGLVDSWIQTLTLEVRVDAFFPGVNIYCDNIAKDANAALERTFKLQGDLLGLGLDSAGVGMLNNTLTAMRKKSQTASAMFEAMLALLPKRKLTAQNARIDIDIYEKMLLGTDLQLKRERIQLWDKFNTAVAAQALSAFAEEFKRRSAARVVSVGAAYAVSGDREALKSYYFALMGQMIEQSKPSGAISMPFVAMVPGWGGRV